MSRKSVLIVFILILCVSVGAEVGRNRNTKIGLGVSLQTSPDLHDKAALKAYELKTGIKCPEVLQAPLLGPNGVYERPCDGKTVGLRSFVEQMYTVERKSFEEYEGNFLRPIRESQAREAKCVGQLLQMIDQNKNTSSEALGQLTDSIESCIRKLGADRAPSRNNNRSVCQNSMNKDFSEKGKLLPADSGAVEAQNLILKQMYKIVPLFCQEADYLEYNKNQLAKSEKDFYSTQRENDKIVRLSSNADSLKREMEENAKKVVYSQKRLKELAQSVFGGGDPATVAYMAGLCSSVKLGTGSTTFTISEEEFLKKALDRNNPNSYQTQVIDKIRRQNDQRVLEGKNIENPLTTSAKVDLVTSGRLQNYVDSLGSDVSQFEDVMCYMNGVYGEGREELHTRTAQITSAVVGVLGGAEFIFGRMVAAEVVGALALAASAYSTIKNDSTCFDGAGYGSFISSQTCESLSKNRGSPQFVDLEVQEMKKRFECVSPETSAVLLANVPIIPGSFRPLLRSDKLTVGQKIKLSAKGQKKYGNLETDVKVLEDLRVHNGRVKVGVKSKRGNEYSDELLSEDLLVEEAQGASKGVTPSASPTRQTSSPPVAPAVSQTGLSFGARTREPNKFLLDSKKLEEKIKQNADAINKEITKHYPLSVRPGAVIRVQHYGGRTQLFKYFGGAGARWKLVDSNFKTISESEALIYDHIEKIIDQKTNAPIYIREANTQISN